MENAEVMKYSRICLMYVAVMWWYIHMLTKMQCCYNPKTCSIQQCSLQPPKSCLHTSILWNEEKLFV